MSDVVFSGFGIEIIKCEERYFMRYDVGGLAVQVREDEISEEEATEAQESEERAYQVLLACQRRS